MSIYVSVSCLGIDEELVKTIKSCFDNASDPENVHMGISFIGDINFKNYIINKINEYGYKNIKYEYFNTKENLGIGKGRILASSFYNNEKYFLQIDAHTLLDSGWDKYLINKFELAKTYVNNDKVILSGYPGKYGYFDKDGNLNFWTIPILQYPYWMSNSFIIEGDTIPKWSDAAPWDLNDNLWKLLQETGFAPLGKISAAFIFSDKKIVEDGLCIDSECLFWEEEIIQTINMIDRGYTLVYPGSECKIFHYYIGENSQEGSSIGKRQSIKNFIPLFKQKEFLNNMKNNFVNFINDEKNKNKIDTFERYNNISLVHGATDPSYFPNFYINSNKDLYKMHP